MHNFSTTQRISKEVVATEAGVVASAHKRAAMAGAAALEAGGDAIDAAVATSFAVGVVEPWMSGPAGGGMMTVWRAEEGRAETIRFGMRSPKGLDVSAYPLDPGRKASDLFPWASVKDDRNIIGAKAIATPGTVAGMGLAHETWGKLPWRDLLQPAAAMAREGMLVDWYATLVIACSTRNLSLDRDAAGLFLVDGTWPNAGGWTGMSEIRLDQSRMAETLDHLAAHGAGAFYKGEIAAALAADVQAKGGFLSTDDLAAYRAERAPAISAAYRGGTVHAASGLSAGPDLIHALGLMEAGFAPGDAPGPESYAALADALSTAYRRRFAEAGDRPDPATAPTSTTHFSVVDRKGNMVAVTQTLLSVFGSCVLSPSTGLMMNNGIMWFDPEPGRPNSLAPDKGCLMNVCPTIVEKGDRRFAIGASGGRKIMPAVANLTSFMLDFDMDLEAAFHQPRIDNTGADLVIADETLSPAVLEALAAKHAVKTAKRSIFPYAFAVPSGVMRAGGLNCGCTEIMSPWGDAVAGG